MQATVNYSDRVRIAVTSALDAPITKPHCHKCGMSFNLKSNADGTWICKRCEGTQSVAPATLSPEASKAKAEAAIRYRETKRLSDKMRQGPYYDDARGELRIPSYFYNPTITPLANAEWKRRGMFFDRDSREWAYPVDPGCAANQVAKAHTVFDRIWNIQSEGGCNG
jgi:ribosomal protein L37AE/L43A